jgi:ABC-type branched-subunit amino acid transport system ATPase component
MTAMLETRRLVTGYGKKQVLVDVSVEIGQGEIVAVIGPNGSGKSTLLKALCGLIPLWSGEVRFSGTPINGFTPAANIARGPGFAPQGNRVFDELTVKENMEVSGFHLHRKLLKSRIQEIDEILGEPIFAVADGIFYLTNSKQGMQNVRRLNVTKMRGLEYFTGDHPFRISTEGIHLFPRIKTPNIPSPVTHPGTWSVAESRGWTS